MGPGGIEKTPFTPEVAGAEKKGDDGPSKDDIKDALTTKVRTLGELKSMLEDKLGKKNGDKLYNAFIKSFAMMMLQQVQQSAEGAKKAAKGMRGER